MIRSTPLSTPRRVAMFETMLGNVTSDQKDTFYHIKKSYIEIIETTKKILKNNKIIP